MSGIGLSELVLLFVIGLLILGPDRLPRVASQIGRWVGRARRTANQLRYQLERELALAEHEKAKKPEPRPAARPAVEPSAPEVSEPGDHTASEPGAAEAPEPDHRELAEPPAATVVAADDKDKIGQA